MIIKEICTDVYSIKPSLHDDNRGSFFELYNKFNFTNLGFDNNFLQDNISFSKKKDTVRGFHYQKPPHEQSKFIFLICGSIIDIFIDIRKESKNFGNCYNIKLNNLGDGLFLPKGFLHGFCTLEDNTIIGYKVDEIYDTDSEIGLNWSDPQVNVKWPFENLPIISDKDSNLLNWDEFTKQLG